MKTLLLSLLVLVTGLSPVIACTGGTSSGILTPTAIYQTIATQNGRYYTVNVTLCDQYEFTFCTGGGSSSFDSQLTILDNTGATQIVYSDDVCGTNASITWTATFTGTIRILVSKYNCVHDLTSNCTLAYKKVANTGSYCLNGNASYQLIGGNNCIQLTPEVNDQTGCAWNSAPIDFTQPFNLSLNYYFGNNINGADGTTFTFQPNVGACGTAGGQLGAGGIANSLIIEFDTYDNDNPAHIFDIAADHIAVETDGNLQGPSAPYCGPTPAFASLANLDDGNVHAIQISWNPATLNLTISVDGALRLTCNGDFINTVFGGNSEIYWGATAATGGLNNQQYFCPNTVVLPVTITSFESVCDHSEEILVWHVESQERIEHYELEYTLDGLVYYPLATIQPIAFATGDGDYAFKPESIGVQRFYKLTSVDENGVRKSTDLIASKNCSSPTTLFQNHTYAAGQLQLIFNEESCSVALFDIQGRRLSSDLESIGKITVIENVAPNSIYLLKVWNNLGKIETYRIFLNEY